MRKFYSFVLFAIMMVVSQVANAWSFDLTDENAVLQSDAYNMRLYKNYNFFGGTFNGEPMTDGAGNAVSGDGCFTLSPDKASFKLNGFDSFQVVSPAEMSNFFIQIGTGALNLRAGVNKDGLHNYGSGSRFFAIADVKEGQIIVCQWGITSSRQSVVQPSTAITGADACVVEDITEEIHAAQIAAAGEGEEAVADNFSYWRATTDGYFVVELQRDGAVQGLQIWIDASAKEAVSAPVMSLAGVNGNSRDIAFKPGESTFGNACSSYYITEAHKADGINYPLFLKETDEVDHYEYTYKVDEEGNFILDEEGNKIVDTETPVYKLVLDKETVEEVGQFGENLYDTENGLRIDNNDDVDGDGYVTIWAATASESGEFSSIVELKVSVGEIQLNAPTFTLVRVDGVDRVYKVGWVNNTLCGEDYTITIEGENGELFEQFENGGIGTTVSVKNDVKASVAVAGYVTGEYVMEDVDFKGINIRRKNAANAEAGKHDWDFVNISDEMRQMFQGEIPGGYKEVITPATEETEEEAIIHTVDEYNKAEAEGVDVSGWEIIPADFGWWYPLASNRTTLNVIEGGVDQNANGFGYAEEKTGIFNGLNISCPPNANNASCIFKYVGKDDGNELGQLGVYFMSKPTITFPRDIAASGELVEIYYGQGGSNYTNTTSHAIYTVEDAELLSVTLPSGGVHVFYIDVFTYDDLPVDAVESVAASANAKVSAIYSVSGAQVSGLQRGINIVKYTDGTAKKVLVK